MSMLKSLFNISVLTLAPLIALSQEINQVDTTLPKHETFSLSLIRSDNSINGMASPQYAVSIDSGGTVNFEGRRNVTNIGAAQFRLSERQLILIRKAVESADVFSLADRYDDDDHCDGFAVDSGFMELKVELWGRSKTIFLDEGCAIHVKAQEVRLRRVKDAIHSISLVRRWIGKGGTGWGLWHD